MNLQWPRVLKEIQKNPKEFYEMGGWQEVLGGEDGDDGEEDAESEFEPEEGSVEEGSEDSDEYESDAEPGEDEDEEEFEDSEDDAPDWEELENQARASDKKRLEREEDMEMGRDRKKQKVGHSSSKSSIPKKR
jgi:nucleosome binding factor SPN SPT16 subunit